MHIQNDVKTITFDAIIALLGGVGTLVCFILTYQLPVSKMILVMALGVSFSYFLLAFSIYKNHRLWALVGTIGYLVIVFFNIQMLRDGILYCFNAMLRMYMANSQYSFSLFQVNIPTGQAAMVVSLTLWAVFTPIFAFIIRSLRQRRNYVIPFILTLPFIFSIVLFTLTPDWNYFLMVLTFWITLLGMQVASHHRNHSVHDTITYLGILFATLGLGVLLLISNVMPRSAYTRDSAVEDLRIKIQTKIKDIIQGTTSQELGELDLRTAQNRYYIGVTDFVVETDNPQTFYLHGYSANRYDDNVWYAPEANDVNAVLFGNDTPYGMNLVNDLLDGVSENELEEYRQVNTIHVQDMRGIQDYLYTPYYVLTDLKNEKSFVPYLDSYIQASDENLKIYTYKTLQINTKLNYNEVQRSAFQNLYYDTNKLENLEVPMHLQGVLQDIQINNLENSTSDQEKIQRIQGYVQSFGKYTLTPGATPDDRDFIEYFVSESKQGYCVHYASLATMLLRYHGIPARYASGYRVDSGQFVEGIARVKDENAHAWVEVLDPVFGWIPLEVTPASIQAVDDPTNAPVMNTPTTQDSPTTKPSDGVSPTPITPVIEDVEASLNWYAIIISLILLMLLPLRVVYKIGRRNTLFHQGNEREVILSVGSYLYQLQRYGLLITDEILSILEEAKFSNHEMKSEQRDEVLAYAKQSAKECAASLTSLKKFRFYVIDCLYK